MQAQGAWPRKRVASLIDTVLGMTPSQILLFGRPVRILQPKLPIPHLRERARSAVLLIWASTGRGSLRLLRFVLGLLARDGLQSLFPAQLVLVRSDLAGEFLEAIGLGVGLIFSVHRCLQGQVAGRERLASE